MKSLVLAALTVAAAGMASPAHAEILEANERGFVTRDTATVSATPMETWIALISPAKWWSSEHSWSGDAANMTLIPQGGGCFCETIPGDPDPEAISLAGSAHHMTVLQAAPLKVLRMRGGLGPLQGEPVDGVLTITLTPIDGGTRVLWEYVVGGYMRYEVGPVSRSIDAVLSEQLNGLVALLGAGPDDVQADDLQVEPSETDPAQTAPRRRTPRNPPPIPRAGMNRTVRYRFE